MLAVLDFLDFVWIILIVSVFAGGSAVYSAFKEADARRLRRLEAKVDLILKELNLKFEEAGGGLSSAVQALADDPAKKIAAIKLYREETGAGLAEAKEAVEAYIAGRS